MLAKAVEYIKESRGIDINLSEIPLDDPLAYENCAAGKPGWAFL